MKRLIVIALLTFSLADVSYAAENYIDRARVIFARIKDNSSPLDSKIGAVEGLRYINPFVRAYMGNFPSIINILDENGEVTGVKAFEDLTNGDKAYIFVESLKAHLLALYAADEVNVAAISARDAALATAKSQFKTDLGDINT